MLPRKLGLIFPPAGRGVPEEGLAMYGGNVDYLVETLGLKTMTPEGYDAVTGLIGQKAEKLAARGAEAVVLMGTSLSFFKGGAFNQSLTQTMQSSCGLPCITMSSAMIDGLRSIDAERVVVATAYNDAVNDRLWAFLIEHGFTVLAVRGLGIEAVEDIINVKQPQLTAFCAGVVASVRGADALLVSCGGLRTLEIITPLEDLTGIPAISSTPHALFAGVKLLGLDARVTGCGRLLSG